MSMIYLAGMGLIWLAPETKGARIAGVMAMRSEQRGSLLRP